MNTRLDSNGHCTLLFAVLLRLPRMFFQMAIVQLRFEGLESTVSKDEKYLENMCFGTA